MQLGPASQRHARHEHRYQEGELVIDVTVSGLEAQQKQDLKPDHGESHRRRREARDTRRPPPREQRQDESRQRGRAENAAEARLAQPLQPQAGAGAEARAPEHGVEVVCNREKHRGSAAYRAPE